MARAHRPILIVKAGSTLPAIRAEHGDFEDWFMSVIGSARRFVVADMPAGDDLGPLEDYAGIVVTGSPSSMTTAEPWYPEAIDLLRQAVEADLPTLGVCFGHQMLAVALGGRVEKNPMGREIGTVAVRLTDAGAADPLFVGVPRAPLVQATHSDAVTELPAGATLLASNERCPVQAFAIGSAVRAVQWHPEFSVDVIRGYVDGRAPLLLEEGLDPTSIRAATTDTDSGARILRNFVEHFVAPRESE